MPADLEGIRKRLDGPVVHYTSKAMLQDDLELMCRNAMLYNDEGTEYYRYKWVDVLAEDGWFRVLCWASVAHVNFLSRKSPGWRLSRVRNQYFRSRTWGGFLAVVALPPPALATPHVIKPS